MRGRLLIYLGMAPGTGKTRRMLEEGRRRKAAGQDVVLGFLARGKALPADLPALEQVPALGEGMDVEALVRRAPQVALVAGLAGANVEGAANRHRFQDVLELLGRGIDVIATANLFELESQAALVEEFAGTRIAERVPDAVIEAAEQVVLCDLPAEELARRFAAGEVNAGRLPAGATTILYRQEVLERLRIMALRQAVRFTGLRSGSTGGGRVRVGESAPEPLRLLVAVSASPNSTHLVRWTHRRALDARAEWVALHVKTRQPLSRAQQEALGANLGLARQLGAEVVILPAESVTEGVLRYAHANGVAQIVVGKSGRGAARGRSAVARSPTAS